MHNIRFLLILLLLLPISILAQIPLNGFVHDEEGQPYIGLELEIFETEQKTYTDIDGHYSFNIAENGIYALILRHPYHDIYKAVTIEDSTEYSVVIRREIRFDEVIVKATRASEKDPIAYSVVKGETLALQNYGQDVPYLLQYEPSMVVTSDGGTGIGYTGMRIRGTDATRIAVTINGIPLNDSESQGVYWVDLPDFAASTDDIQIQRGVGSSTNGSGSFGGSMNFNTNKLHLNSYTKLNGAVGEFGTRKAGISIGTGLIEGHYGIDARYSTIHSDGYIDRASSGLQSLYLSGVYVGNDQSLRFTIFNGHEITYLAWNGLPYQYLAVDSLRTYNVSGQDRPVKPYKDEVDNYNQTHYQLFYNKEFNKQWDLALAPFYTHGKGYYEQYKGDQIIANYNLVNLDTIVNERNDLIRRKWLDNHFYGMSYSLNYSSENKKSDLTIGGLVSQYLGAHFGEVIAIPFPNDSLYIKNLPQRYYDNNATKNDANIFVKYTYSPNEHWQFLGDVQYRYVDYVLDGIDKNKQLINPNEALHFINPKLGISYINNSHLFYVSMAQAGHEPNRSDYTEAAVSQAPKSEFLLDGELGYKWSTKSTGLFVNLYHMMYKDQLALSGKISDVGEPIRINIAESFRRGVELGGTTSYSDFTFMGNMTISQNKAVEFIEYIDDWDTGIQGQRKHQDTDLSFSPNVIAGVGVDYNLKFKTVIPQSLNISYRMKYVGAQFLDNTSSVTAKLEAYNYSNLQLAYNISYKRMKSAILKLQINNLFNQKYVSNGWAYRFNYTDKTVLDWNPSSVAESGREGTYNLIGLFPQAGAHIILGLDVSF